MSACVRVVGDRRSPAASSCLPLQTCIPGTVSHTRKIRELLIKTCIFCKIRVLKFTEGIWVPGSKLEALKALAFRFHFIFLTFFAEIFHVTLVEVSFCENYGAIFCCMNTYRGARCRYSLQQNCASQKLVAVLVTGFLRLSMWPWLYLQHAVKTLTWRWSSSFAMDFCDFHQLFYLNASLRCVFFPVSPMKRGCCYPHLKVEVGSSGLFFRINILKNEINE